MTSPPTQYRPVLKGFETRGVPQADEDQGDDLRSTAPF